MTKRQAIISTIITLLILLSGAVGFKKFKSQKKSTVSETEKEAQVRVVSVKQFEIENRRNKIQIDGRLSAFEKINLAAEVTGRILPGSNYRVGSYFKEGDLLFRIDGEDDKYNLYAQRSNLLNAITQIMPDLKFDYPDAFQKWQNYLNDFDVKKAVKPLPEIGANNEKYFIAGKNIFNLFYSIKATEDRIKNYNIYAPFNGVFLSVNAFPGSLVSIGSNLGQIMNTYRYEMTAPVSLDDLKYLSVGQSVTVKSDELNKVWNGKISRISNTIDQATQSIPVYVSVTGKGLKDGVFVKGEINGGSLNDVAVLSRSLIVDENKVFVLQDDKAVSKQIEIITRTDDEVIVKGLSSDDQVITSGVNNIFEGQNVKL